MHARSADRYLKQEGMRSLQQRAGGHGPAPTLLRKTQTFCAGSGWDRLGRIPHISAVISLRAAASMPPSAARAYSRRAWQGESRFRGVPAIMEHPPEEAHDTRPAGSADQDQDRTPAGDQCYIIASLTAYHSTTHGPQTTRKNASLDLLALCRTARRYCTCSLAQRHCIATLTLFVRTGVAPNSFC